MLSTHSSTPAALAGVQHSGRRGRRRGLMLVTCAGLLAVIAGAYLAYASNWWLLPYARMYMPDVRMTADGRLITPVPQP
ncbi:MAG TPA: hypothetical protein P5572_02690 [Phycisphaerae bacterium]|nr:hypothetical protein [Phycisphaerae bacterium]